MAAPDPQRHPCVVQTDFYLTGQKMLLVMVPKGDEMSGVLFAKTLGRDLANDETPILVIREGWEIAWFDPFSEGD